MDEDEATQRFRDIAAQEMHGALTAAPRAGTPRKIIQLVMARNALIALTDSGEIWVLPGLDMVAAGSNLTEHQWRPLALTLPPR
jgi:hypothetical protein